MNTFKVTLLIDTWSEDPTDWIIDAVDANLDGDEILKSILTVRQNVEEGERN